jgi:hypothetical protein
MRAIAAEAGRHLDPAAGWPLHPLDATDDDAWAADSHGVYMGAAGVLWALDRLVRAGAAESAGDLRSAAEGLHAAYLERCRAPEEPVPGLWMGEAGVLLAAETVSPRRGRHDAILAAVRANARSEELEVMWGAPGTMLAARELHRRTGEERWAAAWRESAAAVWEAWLPDDELGCHLWTQNLYGRRIRYLGPAHGFAGNVLALVDGAELLPPGQAAALASRAIETALATATWGDGRANWAPVPGERPDAAGTVRTQWCHGAPGMICGLAGLPPDDALDGVLAAAGELVWEAGPLAKGPGLCHGTAGNGLALLALFGRWRDERWLARARAFALHALDQVERARREHGRGRFSLWTGDVGVALFALACLDAAPSLPGLRDW